MTADSIFPLERGRCVPVDEVADRAMVALSSGAAFICRHGRSGAELYCCAQHPRGGLRCLACTREHIARHGDEERRCDGCDDYVELIHGVTAYTVASSLKVRTTHGKRGSVTGLIYVMAIGLCPPCATEAGLVAA